MIKAVILDDENHSIETLRWKIEKFCQDIEIVQTFSDSVLALEYLKASSIDLLFIDIEMPRLNGFEKTGRKKNFIPWLLIPGLPLHRL